MGANIPLPALDIRPQQPQNPIEQVGRLMSLRSLMNQQQLQGGEIQMQQQQIKDQQALTKAFQSWDGKSYDDLAKSVIDNGGSGNAAVMVQQHALNLRKTVSDIAATDATTGSKNLETFIGKHKAVGDELQGLKSVPDPYLHGAAERVINTLAQGGVLDQPTAHQLLQGVQSIQD